MPHSRYVSFIIIFAIILLMNCSLKIKKTYTVICFDTEDYITPPEERIDDIPKWLAETMIEEDMTGTFFVIGEKARSLEQRGRKDVIDAMAKHDIGCHTNLGSVHPTITEFLENAEWHSGVDSMNQREKIGFQDIERIFGKKIPTFARHGGSYGPQLVAALGQMGKGYVYSPIYLDENHHIVWFCNALNFHGYWGDPDGFDDFYYKDELFNPAFEKFKENFDQLMQEKDFIALFFGHPTKIRSEQFWDLRNYAHGINPTQGKKLQAPDLRPQETMKVAQKNFGRLMKFCKEQKKDVEFTTFSELMERFSYQKEFVTLNELVTLSEKIISENRPIIGKYFSPAEIFTALAEEIKAFSENGNLLKQVERATVFGPIEMPLSEPEISSITEQQINSTAKRVFDYIKQNGMIPGNVEVDGKKIGAGSLLRLFSRYFLDCTENSTNMSYTVINFDPYPRDNEENLKKELEECRVWPIHKPDLDMSKITYYTMLQCWTLKPVTEK